MNDLNESLSRLLSGDLPAEQAEALLSRIEQEPEVARAWELMRLLGDDLAALPELTPPPELDGVVLASVDEAPAPVVAIGGFGAVVGRALPWMAVAAALLLAFWPVQKPEMILASGDQWIDGDTVVLAGTHRVEVQGRALISVEPAGGHLRVPKANTENSMNKDILMGALAGAVVTVAVYEGSARIFPADTAQAAAIEVAAGEAHTLGTPRPPATPMRVKIGEAPAGETPEQAVERLTAERDALVQALSTSKFEGAMVKGQLAAHQGEPIGWTDDIPKRFHPAAVEAGIESFLADHEDVELSSLDCSEFPCIATFQPLHPGDATDPMAAARTLPSEYAKALFGEGSQVMASVAQADGEGLDPTTMISVAAVPAEGFENEDWQTRTQYRTQNITEDFVGEMDANEGDEVELHH